MKRIYTLAVLLTALLALPTPASAQTVDLAKGSLIWKENCMRCHNARSSMERTDRDWATIAAHMRARANLTKSETRAILAFLQATNAPEGGAVTPPPTPTPTDRKSKATTTKPDPKTGGAS